MKLAQKLKNYSKFKSLEEKLYKQLTNMIDKEPELSVAYVSQEVYPKEFLTDFCGFLVEESIIGNRKSYKIIWGKNELE